MDEILKEKIYDDVKRGENWDINKQIELEKKQYKETALKLIAKAICHEDLKEIKEIIEDLENEIGEI